MKNQSLLLTAFLIFSLTACMENGLSEEDLNDGSASGTSLFTTASYDASTEALISTSFEDVDETTDEAMGQFFNAPNGRFIGFNNGYLECATVTRDSVNRVITIDFGEGCEDRRGILRSGKIIIEHGGEFRQPGSYRMVSFENFYIDSIGVEGIRTITNVTDTTLNENLIVHETTLEGGKLTFTDGTTITREANHTRTRYQSDTREESYVIISGNASGTLQDSTDYSMEIPEDILISGSCNRHVPVQGIKEFVAGETIVTMDFGDGTCDNLADLTINGETQTIELKDRPFIDREHKGKRGKGKHG